MVLDPIHILYMNVHPNSSGLLKKKKKTQLCNDNKHDAFFKFQSRRRSRHESWCKTLVVVRETSKLIVN